MVCLATTSRKQKVKIFLLGSEQDVDPKEEGAVVTRAISFHEEGSRGGGLFRFVGVSEFCGGHHFGSPENLGLKAFANRLGGAGNCVAFRAAWSKAGGVAF